MAGSDRGAAGVELALVTPLLLLMLFGIIDFGRMMNAQITLTEAAREGARAVAVGLTAQANVEAATSTLSGVTTQTVSCPENPATADNAEVTVSYPFQPVTPIGAIIAMFGKDANTSFTITATGVMPCGG